MRESSRRKRSAASHADTLCRLDSKPAARPKRGRHAREERERRKILTTSSEPRERLLVLMHRRFRSPRRAERRIYRLVRTRRRAAVSKTAGRWFEANRVCQSLVFSGSASADAPTGTLRVPSVYRLREPAARAAYHGVGYAHTPAAACPSPAAKHGTSDITTGATDTTDPNTRAATAKREQPTATACANTGTSKQETTWRLQAG